jgi:hypothetical protein
VGKEGSGMDNNEFDRRVEVVEDALYALKNELPFFSNEQIRTIDNMLALPAEAKVFLYGRITGQ